MAEMAQMTPLATLCRVRMLNMRRYNGLGSVRLPLSGQKIYSGPVVQGRMICFACGLDLCCQSNIVFMTEFKMFSHSGCGVDLNQ